ncbi:MAG: hypothetical protein GWP08_02530 [Nitrospiraceae bacterium]|nr:hypothetical protein [Nitrospiraceae bacterium]
MGTHDEPRSTALPPTRFVLAAGGGLAAFSAALLAIPVLAYLDRPVLLAALIPFGVLAAAVFVWNTLYGLCFAAFAIAPLGIVQVEVATVTVNLPEILILLLFAKEIVRFVVYGEKVADSLPKRSLLLFIAVSLIGLATGFFRGHGFSAVLQDCRQYTEYVVLYLLVIHRVRTRRQMKAVLLSFLAGMTLLAVHAILQRFTGIGIAATQLISDTIYHQGIRSGSFYGATPLGGMMVLALGVTAGLALSTRSIAAKAILGVCACLCLTAAVFTNTRASWMAIAFGGLFLFTSIHKTRAVILFTVLGAIVFSTALGPIVMHRMRKLEISKTERSLLERVNYYTAAWYIFREHPVLGLGWGCEFNVRQININKRYVAPERYGRIRQRTQWNKSTVHSAYLQVLVRTGLLGLGGLLVMLIVWGLAVLDERTQHGKDLLDHNLFVGVSSGLLGYLFHAGLENFFQWPVMAQSFWLLLGLSTAMAYQIRHTHHIDRGHTPAHESVSVEA